MTNHNLKNSVYLLMEECRFEVLHYTHLSAVNKVEMTVRPANRSYPKECCFVSIRTLQKLCSVLGTTDIFVTGFDMGRNSEDRDYVAYILAKNVFVPKKTTKRRKGSASRV